MMSCRMASADESPANGSTYSSLDLQHICEDRSVCDSRGAATGCLDGCCSCASESRVPELLMPVRPSSLAGLSGFFVLKLHLLSGTRLQRDQGCPDV